MKFRDKVLCTCGHTISVSTYGDGDWPAVVCPKCQTFCVPWEALSVSPTAERLLHRSKAELEDGDYSLSIVLGTFAVEAFLAGLFLKAKRIDVIKARSIESYRTGFGRPTQEQEEAWKRDFRKERGFTKAADFVSKTVTRMTFDDFVARNKVATKIMAEFPDSVNQSAKKYFQLKLFECRNRIAHWGYVDSTKEEAQLCHTLAIVVVSLLREMDKSAYSAL